MRRLASENSVTR